MVLCSGVRSLSFTPMADDELASSAPSGPEAELNDVVDVFLEDMKRPSRGDIPKAHGGIGTGGRKHSAVGTEFDISNQRLMTLKSVNFGAAVQVPDADRLVRQAGGNQAGRRC